MSLILLEEGFFQTLTQHLLAGPHKQNHLPLNQPPKSRRYVEPSMPSAATSWAGPIPIDITPTTEILRSTSFVILAQPW